MATTQHTRLSALRDPVGALRAFENKHVAMDATEYLSSSRRVCDALRSMGVVELIVIAKSMMPVLAQLADNVLIERGADHLADEPGARARARVATAALLQRL